MLLSFFEIASEHFSPLFKPYLNPDKVSGSQAPNASPMKYTLSFIIGVFIPIGVNAPVKPFVSVLMFKSFKKLLNSSL